MMASIQINESALLEEVDKLGHFSNELLKSYSPVIVFLIVLAIVGISGNVTTVVYFGKNRKKSSNEVFISFLAGVDLTVSVLIFIYVWQLVGNISIYTARFWCKAAFFVFHWTILLSVALMCAIAIDRFRKVCFEHGKQTSPKTALGISIALLLLTLVLSARDFVTYDSVAVNVTISNITVEGRMCMNIKTLEGAVKASHVIDIILVWAILLTLVISYGAIVYKLCKHKKRLEASAVQSLDGPKTSNAESASTMSHQMTDEMPKESGPHPRRVRLATGPPHQISIYERTFTLMMLTATLSLLVCFLPYFIVTFLKLKHTEVEFELTAGYRFAIGCSLANSAVNPIVYLVFNKKYRNFLMKGLFRCVRREIEGQSSETSGTNETYSKDDSF